MVSSVLAQAILNQDVPDIVGSFREGEEIARQQKVRELSGQALAGEGIDPLLGEIAPEVALALGEQLRARSAKDISDFLRDAGIARSKLQAGDVQGALQFGMQRRNAIKLRGGDTTQTDEFIQAIQQSPEGALDQLNALFGSLDQAKPAGLREFEALTAGLSEEESARARRIKLGLEARAGISPEQIGERERQKLIAQQELKPSVQRAVGDVKVQQDIRAAAGKESAKLAAQLKLSPEVKSAVALAVQQAKDTAKVEAEEKSNVKALAVYEAGIQGLQDALAGTETGFFAGRAPSITANQQIADGAVAAMAPILKQLFRSAGEGNFTDADQRLLLEMVPTRKDSPAARKAKLENIDSIVRAKLGATPEEATSVTPQQAPAQSPTGGIKFLGFE